MPPRISFSREDIIKAALDVIREKGHKRLTVREIAKKMKGSTQPVYREFKTIEELEESAKKAAGAIALKYMMEAKDDESNFLSVGIGYLEFAKNEPELFHLLFMSGKRKFGFGNPEWPIESIVSKMKTDPFLKDLGTGVLKELLTDMHIYTHGLCSIASIDPDNPEIGKFRDFLHKMGEKLIILEILIASGKLNLEKIKRRYKHENKRS